MSQSGESAGCLDADGGKGGKENSVFPIKGAASGWLGVRIPLGDVTNRIGKRGPKFDSGCVGSAKGNGQDKRVRIGLDGTDILPIRRGLDAKKKDGGQPKSMPCEEMSDGTCAEFRTFDAIQPHQAAEFASDDVKDAQMNQVSCPSHIPAQLDDVMTSLNIEKNDYASRTTGGDGSKDSCNASVSPPINYQKTDDVLPTDMTDGSEPIDLPSIEIFAGTDPSLAKFGYDASVKNEEGLNIVSSVQSLTSNDINFQFVDSQESAVNCGTDICNEVFADLIQSRAPDCRTINFGLLKPEASEGDEDKLCADNGLDSANIGLESIKNCSCSICLKASSVLSELHYQDFKGRLIEVKRSIKQVRNLIGRNYGHGMLVEPVTGVSKLKQSSTLESDLAHHWKDLFLHTENALVRESSQIQSSLKKLKGVNENLKQDLEMGNASSQRNP